MNSVAALFDVVAAKMTGPNLAALGLLLATTLAASTAMFLQAHPGPRGLGQWLRYALPREILAHPSARVDFLFWVTRRFLMPVLLLPTSAAAVATVGYATHTLLGALLGAGHHAPGPAGPWTILFFTSRRCWPTTFPITCTTGRNTGCRRCGSCTRSTTRPR